MPLRTATLAATTVLVVVGGPARAEDGPYLAAGGFGFVPRDQEISLTGGSVEARTIVGGQAQGAIGYGFGDRFRVELEGGFAFSPFDRIETSNTTLLTSLGVTGATGTGASTRLSADGDITRFGGALNGYLDFDAGNDWFPYVGLGVGYARTEYDLTSGGQRVTSGTDEALMAQAMVGTAWRVSRSLRLHLGYRAVGTDELSLTGFDSTAAETDIAVDHVFEIGLRFSPDWLRSAFGFGGGESELARTVTRDDLSPTDVSDGPDPVTTTDRNRALAGPLFAGSGTVVERAEVRATPPTPPLAAPAPVAPPPDQAPAPRVVTASATTPPPLATAPDRPPAGRASAPVTLAPLPEQPMTLDQRMALIEQRMRQRQDRGDLPRVIPASATRAATASPPPPPRLDAPPARRGGGTIVASPVPPGPAPVEGQGAGAQLGVFRSLGDAQQAWARLRGEAAGALDGITPVIRRVGDLQGERAYGLFADISSDADAMTELCRRLAVARIGCRVLPIAL